MKELHLTFYNSQNRKVKEVLKNIRQDITAAEVQEVMEDMVRFDQPQQNGVRRHARVASAKFVERIETVLFVNDVKPQVTLAEAQEKFYKRFLPKEEKAPRPAQTTITVSQMTRFSPVKTAGIMYNDVKENHNQAIPRYLSNLMNIKLVNGLLTKKHQIDPQLFTPVLKQMYALPKWNTVMVRYLPDLKEFFPTPDWSAVVTRFASAGREAAACLAGSMDAPDYQQADQQIKALQQLAQKELHQYQVQKAAFSKKLQALSA